MKPDFEEFMKDVTDAAKTMLNMEGKVLPHLLAAKPEKSELNIIPLDYLPKHLWKKFALIAIHTIKPEYYAFIDEVWMSKKVDAGIMPSEDPDRTEAVMAWGYACTGEIKYEVMPFKRVDNKIEFTELEEEYKNENIHYKDNLIGNLFDLLEKLQN